MEIRHLATSILFLLMFVSCMQVEAQQPSSELLCPENSDLPDLLSVDDQVSQFGLRIENAQLVLLANGRKSVVFSIRSIPVNGIFPYGHVRYSVTWNDACGRLLPDHSTAGDGFFLNSNEYKTIQSVAFYKQSVRAVLRIYLE